MIRAAAARGMGLIDELVDSPQQLRWAARKAVLQKRKSKPRRLREGAARQVAGARLPRRARCAQQTREKVREDHYPAPFRLIDLFEKHGGNLEALKKAETRAFAPLMVSRHLAQPAPRVPPVRAAEGPGAEGPRLQADARARDRRRHHGRRHRRLVRRLRHGGDAAGSQRRSRSRRASRRRPRRSPASSRPRPQRDAAKARLIADPDGRRHRPRRRRHRGDRREARGQAEAVQEHRGQAEARRGAGVQHVLDHDRGHRRGRWPIPAA